MKTQTTTPYGAHIGDELYFRQADFTAARTAAQKMYVPIEKMVSAYSALGLPESFSTETLHELLSNGTEKVRQRFEETAKQDLNKFRSPALKQIVLQEIERYMEPLERAVSEAKATLQNINQSGHSLSVTDYKIVDGEPFFDEANLREKHTVRIQNEKQAHLFDQLQNLVALYNETLGLVKTAEVNNLFGMFIIRKDLGFAPSGVPIVSNEVEVRKEALALIQ